MQKKYRITFIAIILTVVCLLNFSSCKSEFDVIEDWKDIPVVYAILDQSDSVQYVRINRAFSGELDAYQMASVYDSINYNSKFDVFLEQWRNGAMVGNSRLDTVWTYKKQGIFNSDKQVLYKYIEPLDYRSEYKLKVIHPNGTVITASTVLVHPFYIEKPLPPMSEQSKISLTNTAPIEYKWLSAKNGRRYQIILRFNYKERNIQTNAETNHFIDWRVGTQLSKKLTGGEEMSTKFYGESFYVLLGNKLKPLDGYVRVPMKMDVTFLVAADDLNTYMEITEPSNGIIQERPDFTNLSNAIGIFSARYKQIRSYPLTPNSIDSLVNGRYTRHLGFRWE